MNAIGRGPGFQFWAHCAGEFKDNPNVFFALSGHDAAQVGAIRTTGARQPIIVRGFDGQVRDPNIIYQVTPRRSSMSLINVAYNSAFNWSDPSVHSLEEQALRPMFSTNPVELGVRRICSN